MNRGNPLEYPLNAPLYLPAFDDGQWVQQELQQASETWRSEKWSLQSNVLILDHDRGDSTIRYDDDAGLTTLLEEPDPQIRFIRLAPTNQEKIQHKITDHKGNRTPERFTAIGQAGCSHVQTLQICCQVVHHPPLHIHLTIAFAFSIF